jgi:aryl-alcohol dehydrogenase-like predicted oxidoreductase
VSYAFGRQVQAAGDMRAEEVAMVQVGSLASDQCGRGSTPWVADADGPSRGWQEFLGEFERYVRQRSSLSTRWEMEKALGSPLGPNASLQQAAMTYLLEQPAVTCVLLGAKRPEYVEDALELMEKFPPLRHAKVSGA